MEITKKQMIQIIIGIIFGVFIFVFFLFYGEHNKNKTREIFKVGKFSIAQIIDYKPRSNGGARTIGNSSEVQIMYIANDSLINGRQYGDKFFVPSDTLNEKINYLVVYDSINPKNFRVLFDCPIRDSYDFYKYLSDSTRILKDHYNSELDKRL